jgi:hypothetical protein
MTTELLSDRVEHVLDLLARARSEEEREQLQRLLDYLLFGREEIEK